MRVKRKKNEFITLTLQDGRSIGLGIYGSNDGYPVFYFHGFPGCRIEARLLEPDIKQTNFRIISPDRPGIGLSDHQPNRTLKDWPKDVLEIANQLKLSKFGILGISGGGPYALAVARYVPYNRLAFVFIISAMGPLKYGVHHMKLYEQLGLRLSKISEVFPSFLIFLIKLTSRNRILFNFNMHTFVESMASVDKKLLDRRSGLKEILYYENYFSFKDNVYGIAQDARIYASDWEFELSDLERPYPIYLLHGTVDNIIPLEMAKNMANEIPDCIFKFYQGEGHFSTATRLKEYLSDLENLF